MSRWILLAEDNDDDLALALRAIRKLEPDVRVVTARDGQEAILQLEASGDDDPPSLILLDMKMPKRSGLDALQSIRQSEELRYVPVVMLTSSDEPDDVSRSYAGGANSYTVKAVDFEHFSAQIKRTIDYWTRINRQPKDG